MNNTGFINFTKNNVPRDFTLQGNAQNKHVEVQPYNLVLFYFRKETADASITEFNFYRCVFDEANNIVNTEKIVLSTNYLTITSTHIYCDLNYWYWGDTGGRYYAEIKTDAGNTYISDIFFVTGAISELYLLTSIGDYILTEAGDYILYN